MRTRRKSARLPNGILLIECDRLIEGDRPSNGRTDAVTTPSPSYHTALRVRRPRAAERSGEKFFVGFEEINQQAGASNSKARMTSGLAAYARGLPSQVAEGHPVTQLRHDLWPLQVLPDKALHFMHQGNPNMLAHFNSHVICSLEGSGCDQII